MGISDQLLAAIKDADKVAIPIALAAGAVLVANWLSPAIFLGIHDWVLPWTRFVAIVAGVLGVIHPVKRFFRYTAKIGKKFYGKAMQPKLKKSLQRDILAAPDMVKYQLLFAMGRMHRRIAAPSDHPYIMWMKDRGVIEPIYGMSLSYLDYPHFEITDFAWRTLFDIPNFLPIAPKEMREPWIHPIGITEFDKHIPAEVRRKRSFNS